MREANKKVSSPVLKIPDKLRTSLPKYDINAPAVQAEDGRVIIAGRYALIIGDGSGITDSGMWYEVQFARWDANTRELNVVWVDPNRTSHEMVTSEDNPKRFMEALTSRVNDTIVLTEQVETDSGALITASVRRRIDGELFSTVIIQGNPSYSDEKQAAQLESKIRQDLGLDNK